MKRKCISSDCDTEIETTYLSKNGKTHYRSRCYKCHHNLYNYRMTGPARDLLLVSQNNKCAICGSEVSFMGRTNNSHGAVVDHCHSSEEVRGILCGNCNIALGLFKDNVETLSNAINYLKGTKE